MNRFLVALILAALLGLATAPVWPAPPDNADPALAPFFGGLTLEGVSCCSLSDCRSVTARPGNAGWEAFVRAGEFPGATEDLWVAIPADKIVRNKSHPYGLAALCWKPDRGVLCFVEPPGV